MRRSTLSLLIPLALCILSASGFSQTPVLSPEETQRLKDASDLNNRMQALKELQDRPLLRGASPNNIKVDKDAKERIAELRRVDPKDIDQFHSFLRSKNTGIFKLFPNMGCTSAQIIRIDGDCAGFVPDSSDYSFLQRTYAAEPTYHDIGFYKDEIVSRGFFSQGVLVSLGGIPIEDVKTDQEELRGLSKLNPSISFIAAKKAALMFEDGNYDNGHRYASHLKVTENTTYGLRIMAYKMRDSYSLDVSNLSPITAKFYYLNLIPRADVTLIFRIVRRDEDGALIIVWKELNRQKAPMIRFAKGEKLDDLR